METFFTGAAFRIWLDTAMIWLTQKVFTTTMVVYTAMQVPALVGSGFAAWWLLSLDMDCSSLGRGHMFLAPSRCAH